jgi:hypothetical protein
VAARVSFSSPMVAARARREELGSAVTQKQRLDPGFRGAHSQETSLDELRRNLEEAVNMLLRGDPALH